MGRAKRRQIETIGTTTHKNKISHTKKQNGTTTHSNKKTSLKITNKTKQKGKITHKKTTFYYLLIEKMATLQQTYKKHAIGRAPKGTKRGLYAFLDGFEFADQFEIQDAILQYYKIDAPAYSELVRADEIADEYIDKRHIENIYYLPF